MKSPTMQSRHRLLVIILISCAVVLCLSLGGSDHGPRKRVPPPFPDGQSASIPGWSLADVISLPTPVAAERPTLRLARPGPLPSLIGSTSVHAIVPQSDILWVATDGGLFRWNPVTFVYDQITVADGLGSDQTNGVAIAPDGAVWVATEDGLSRYTPGREDSPDWTTYTVQNTSGGMIADSIVAVVADSEGHIWVGTSQGLCRFAPNPDDLDGAWQTMATNVSVRVLQVDAQGTVWIGTGTGLFRTNGDVIHTETAGGLLTERAITAISQDGWGRLWVAAGDRLLRHDMEQSTWTILTDAPGRPAGEARVLLSDNSPIRMWVATENDLGRNQQLNRSNEQWQTLASPELAGITALALDGNGVLWIGTRSGLFRYWEIWEHNPAGATIPDRLGSYYFEIFFDDSGSLWATPGSWHFDDQEWTHLSEADGLAAPYIRGVISDGAGGVWVGHRLGTISHFDGQQWRGFRWSNEELSCAIDVMALGRDRSLWIGGRCGLVRVTWQDETHSDVAWQAFSDFGPNSKSRFRQGRINDIATDNTGGIWVATGLWGLLRYADGDWTAYPDLFQRHSSSAPQMVVGVELDARGQLWVTGKDHGIGQFDGQTWQVITRTATLPNLGTFTNPRYPLADTVGGIWLWTHEQGISYHDGCSWWTYTQDDGLPRKIYHAALHPLSGQAWFATETGLVRFDGARWEQLRLDQPVEE